MNHNLAASNDAVKMALFLRRMAHRRMRTIKALFPEYKGEDNYVLQNVRQDLREAIRWIKIAKYRRDKSCTTRSYIRQTDIAFSK